LTNFTSGWNLETHMLIARMAHDILMKENPIAVQNAEELLKVYSDNVTMENEGDHPFVEGVVLADLNKRRGGGW
jgi:hypothetical protein